MALQSQAVFQREMQRANSKASMQGQRPRTQALMSRLADMDLARKLAFSEIGLTRRSADIQHRGRKAGLKASKKDLKDRKQQMRWSMGVGLGTTALSTMEGRRRANVIAAQNAKADQRYTNTQRDSKTYNYGLRERLGILPVSPASSGRI